MRISNRKLRLWNLVLDVLLLLALLLGGLPGCAATKGSGPNGTLTPGELQVAAVQSEQDVRTASGIATTVVLLNLSDAERQEVGSFAYSLADAAYTAVDQNKLDLTNVKGLASQLINESHLKHKEAVGFLLQSIASVIEQRVQLPTASAADKDVLTRAMIKGAAAGVRDATQSYAPHSRADMNAIYEDPAVARWVIRPDLPALS